MFEFLHPTRRGFLLTASAFTAWSFAPQFASAAPGRDPRFLMVVLRGGMDGLAVIEPAFDPDFERARAGLILGADGSPAGLPIVGGFVMNPKLAALHDMFAQGQALAIHAVATPYRDRSHFDGQDVLESGMPGTGAVSTGWLNRAMSQLGKAGSVKTGGLAIGPTVPLIMRGPASTLTWAAGGVKPAPEDARARLLNFYKSADPTLANAFGRGLDLERIAVANAGMNAAMGQPGAAHPEANSNFVKGMEMVAKLFTDPNGPRIGAIDLDGWDTHATERPEGDNLGKALAELDAGLAALKVSLGPAWDETVVVVATEFGRTVRMNGTEGTDHGTATVAFLAGGAVKGGRVLADWPGLADKALFQQRDLAPTTDLRAVLKGALRDHLGIEEAALGRDVFPDSGAIKPLDGLLKVG
ncbi:DUF1501 domain-containing protein [Rhizobium sp. C1]|uniref:DUF1501 domain-containing protein n=1 Tax=Rhizobium sp. C1 TaxID=1349799 RepID=UPI001E46A7BF|nr:DUF1501 domain-containing protein [Rhizobium sp. C1]MCD2176798.1 DUF1501 domain-containing protein [Rhizobium sp. C1]